MKVNHLVILSLVVLFPFVLYAQKQDNTWCYGNGRLINFNSVPAPTLSASSIFATENCATVSDNTTGNLLFYTNGVKVWDRTHKIMPNGTNIGYDTAGTTAQGCVIASNIADTNKYYVFTLEPNSGNPNVRGRLAYTVIDMSLNGGLGDVDYSQKNIPIKDSLSESLTLIQGNCCMWLLAHSILKDSFFAFKITPTGITTKPVVSVGGYPYLHNGVGYIKASPDGKKLALSSVQSPVLGSFIALHDFDVNTGKVSNGIIIDNINYDLLNAYFYALEFSPNSSKLFVNMRIPAVYQYDISLGTAVAIKASKTYIPTPLSDISNGLQLGPDNKLYVAGGSLAALGQISNPDIMYPGCTYKSLFILSTADQHGGNILGLPQKAGYVNATFQSNAKKISTCFGQQVALQAPDGAAYPVWQDGSASNYFYTNTAGTYWVKSAIGCTIHTDSFIVVNTDFNFDLGKDTSICTNQPMHIGFNIPDASYQWQDGSTANPYTINKAGTYKLKITVNGCSKWDELKVLAKNPPDISLGNDTVLCLGDTLMLQVSDTFKSYKWSTGSNQNTIIASTTGNYSVSVFDGFCTTTDDVNLNFFNPTINLGPDELLCTGETKILSANSFPGSTYKWSDGSTEDHITVTKPGMYTVKAINKCGEFSDEIIVDFENCDCIPIIPSAFTPNKDGRNDYIQPHLSCSIASYNFIIVNRFGQEVFSSTDPTQKWDGTQNGKACDIGTYFYLLKLRASKNRDFLFKGDITLLR